MNTSIEPGQVIGGRWRIDQFLASGGFGRVFTATDVSSAAIGSTAVKVLLEGSSTAERESFLAEVRHMSVLHHPNLVSHIDSGPLTDGEGAVFLVTDLCEESLDDYRQRQPTATISEQELASVIADVSAGLDYLHQSGRVHRDLKPANILRSGDGWKLADFGLVRDLSRSGVYHLQSLVGSPRYMAPEFFGDGMVGPGTDIWSVGVIAHELMTGKGVYTGEGAAYIHAVTSTEPTIAPSLPPSVKNLISRCLETDPAKRPTAGELPGLLSGNPTGAVAGIAADTPSSDDQTRNVAPPIAAAAAGGAVASPDATVSLPPPTAPPAAAAEASQQAAAPVQPAAVAGQAPLGAAPSQTPISQPPATTANPEIGPAPTEQILGSRRVWWLAAAAAVVAAFVIGFGALTMFGDDDDLDSASPDSEPDVVTSGDASGDDEAAETDTDADAEAVDAEEVDDAEGDDATDAGSADEDAAGEDATATDAGAGDGADAGASTNEARIAAGPAGVSLDQFEPQDCANIEDVERFVIDTVVACDEPHIFEVLAMFELPQAGGEYPGPDGMLQAGTTFCPEAFIDRFGVDQAQTTLSVLGMAPTEDDWNNQIYQIACVTYRSDFAPLMAPVENIDDWQWSPGDSLTVIELQPGFCFDAPVDVVEDGFDQRIVYADCSEPHDGQHYFNTLLAPPADGVYNVSAARSDARRGCHDEMHNIYSEDHNDAGFTSFPILPSEELLTAIDVPIAVCVVIFDTPTAGSLEELANVE